MKRLQGERRTLLQSYSYTKVSDRAQHGMGRAASGMRILNSRKLHRHLVAEHGVDEDAMKRELVALLDCLDDFGG